MATFLNFRALSLLGFAACAGAMGFALYLQYAVGLEPCPMCIFQRVAMIACGLVFLMAAVHGPVGAGQWVYASLAELAALAGAFIAGRHVWLQGLPPDQVPACGPPLDYLMDAFPFLEVVSMIVKGDGNCAKIDAAWLGLSLPGWTLAGFAALSVLATLTVLLPRILNRSAA